MGSSNAGRPRTGKTKLAVSDFVHLHNHTQYSLLDGLTKVKPLMERVKQLGMEAVAITDHGTLSGLVEFYQHARERDIRPILGMEAYIAARKHTDKDPAKDKNYYHLTLLAMNEQGYKNLMKLSTKANLEGFYYKPRIDHDLLDEHNNGLIVLSGCASGEIGEALKQGQYDQAKKIASWYKKVFKDRYYLEVQDHGHPKHTSHWAIQKLINEQVLRLSQELSIPAVVTCDAHYLEHTDQEAHEVLLCVQTGSFLSDSDRMSLKDFELHVTDPAKVIQRWGKEYPELITNSKQIAERCHVELPLGNILIPSFPLPEATSEKDYLHKLVYQGLVWRYGGVSEDEAKRLSVSAAKKSLPKEVQERAAYELGVIDRMKFSSYFLIIADFINWGKDKGIVFGPGRGSAAGSIIAYALRITELDPLKYDLLFERFLNPDRISMPDIDIDIQDSRRDEVIAYCVEKYGSDQVANIVTFGRMAARNAVRDVARVLQVPYSEADRLAKMIPPPVQGRHTPLEKSIQDQANLKAEYTNNKSAKQVFDLATQLEGTIRSHGVHAAGVVIAPDEIVNYTPLEMAQKGVVTTQYSMGPIEDLGLLKIDFLGLSNLTIIKNTLRIIKKVHGKDIDIDTIPLNDAKTYQLLQRGDTTGVFQLESAGMKRYLKDLKPTVFEDIVAMVALYRPGPMQWIDNFISRKHGRKNIEYVHPSMEPALKSTYGVIVYQEQVMQISKEMCGFSGGQADTLRKAIGKKIPEVMAKLKNDFIEGAIKTVGADRKMMEKFWKQLEDFAAYCFNKSHAACYAMIAYWTAYLKAHYPAAFMAALMTSDFNDTDRLAIEINECRHVGIEVLAPDVNESFLEFAIVKDTSNIRFGLSAIKNVGAGAAEEIIRARGVGSFQSLEDFFEKVDSHIVNRKALESLIKAGALDSLEERSTLLHNIDMLVAFASRLQKQAASGQADLFGADASVSYASQLSLDTPPLLHTPQERLQWERELLGLYLSEHPLKAYKALLKRETIPLESLSVDQHDRVVTVGGVIADAREITTKGGVQMAFIKLSDDKVERELVIFPKIYQQTQHLWVRDKVILATGRISGRDRRGNELNEVKVLVEQARVILPEEASRYQDDVSETPLQPMAEQSPRVYIRLPNSDDADVLISLKETIDKNQGETDVVLVVGDEASRQIIRLPARMDPSEESLNSLELLVGSGNVRVK